MFDIDASSEASRANRVGGSVPSSRQISSASGSNQPVKDKKIDTPPVFSSSSSSRSSRGSDERPVLLPVETQPTSPLSIHSSAPSVSPVSIRSSRSNTIEYDLVPVQIEQCNIYKLRKFPTNITRINIFIINNLSNNNGRNSN